MSFTVVTSDDPRVLVDRLSRELRESPLSPFEMERVVIQSYGMERWIRLELAKRLGCAASLDFSFPAALCHTLASSLGAGELDARFGREALTWRVFGLLTSAAATRSEFAPLARTLAQGDDAATLGLATRLAARFDDYQLYRPEILLAWEEGVETHESGALDAQARAHVAWQAALWRELCAGAEPMHLGRWIATAHERLIAATEPPPGLPSRLTVFGVSTMPDLFMKLLRAASRFTPVRMYVVAPPRSAWGVLDDETRNPLTRAFAKSARGLLAPLSFAPEVQWEELPSARAHSNAVLGVLQSDVRAGLERGTNADAAPAPLADDDRSLSVHVCHSELRELEVLRDQILAAFDADPSLRPHDVLVMVPDVAKYAPFAEAVFGTEEPRIPFHVADRPIAQESSLAQGLIRILSLMDARLTASEVLGLLDVPAIARGAGLGVDAAVQATPWVEAAAIRWGRDGEMRAERFGLPAFACNTWREGLDRLVLGYATGACDAVVDDLLPVSGETLGDAAALGAFADWVRRLFERLDDWRSPRPLVEWVASLRDTAAEFLVPDGDRELRETAKLGAALDRIERAASAAQLDRVVGLGLVRHALERELGDDSFGSALLTGRMTICALKPMRTLPFRVIAMAGMDDASFPRRTRRAGYDLLEIDPRRDPDARVQMDRDIRADDRQLFFDTLLAAGERLIISYVGRSARDNKARAESVVVAELLDVIDRAFVAESGAARNAVVVEHRLQPFSAAYFTGEATSKLFSYSVRHARAREASMRRAAPPAFIDAVLAAGEDVTVVRLDDLVACWRNPAEFFARRTLGVRLAGGADVLDDSEPMDLDALASYRLRDDLLQRHLRGRLDLDADRARLRRSGLLPPAKFGDALLDAAIDEAKAFLDGIGNVTIEPPLAIDVAGDGWRVVGRVGGLLAEGPRLQARASKYKAKDGVVAWVLHVAMNAQLERDGQTLRPTRIVNREFDGTIAPAENAASVLAALVRGYRDALSAPAPFFPECSYLYARPPRRAVKTTALERAAAGWKPNERSRGGAESQDEYVKLCWAERSPLADEASFGEWARTFWSPMIAVTPGLP